MPTSQENGKFYVDFLFLNFELNQILNIKKPNSSASNRIINARDHASIQLNIADVDPVLGVMTGKYKTYAICGSIRQMGESDDSMNHMSKRDGILPS